MVLQSQRDSLVFALSGLFLLAMVYFLDPEFVGAVTREDGILENMTALLFAGGMFASLYALYQRKMVLLAGLWAFLCLFFLGEEVSWFQRVFDYSVPFVEQNSTQGEFNLHNLNIINEGRVLNEDGTLEFSVFALVGSQNMFRLGFAGYFLALPLLSLVPMFKRLLDRTGYVRPSTAFLTAVWSVIFVSFVLAFITVAPVKNYVAETREIIYAAVIFIYTLSLSAGVEKKAALAPAE
ncbi:MAG TPA: hypothetical protein ENJ90_03755 [Devosia sp.]|nr:hypothetical protein [Devosia sp.]